MIKDNFINMLTAITVQNKTEELQEVVRETYNTEFRLTTDGTEWRMYIVKSRTLFRGTLEEVLDLATEEFISYRTVSTQRPHIKKFKPYSYL